MDIADDDLGFSLSMSNTSAAKNVDKSWFYFI
jgi:hypothetical protein